ncbi:hypothetical protein BKA70DRAFT_1296066 [Coprinopsis sp. MPI-PUGE-AT-0042]|nr:hypothetical protein BKA70DRAFT_1296066 [Coprinopsis sp. MPI-PUGE-AT-0042]
MQLSLKAALALLPAMMAIATPVPGLGEDSGVEGRSLEKRANFQVSDWLWSSTCSGTPSFSWGGLGNNGCVSHWENGANQDIYSLKMNNIGDCPSAQHYLRLYHDNDNCTGSYTTIDHRGTSICIRRGGNKFRSFKINCSNSFP